ncbi:MAG: hypothetical protein ACRDD1_21730 [Planctomycetia bacterium]
MADLTVPDAVKHLVDAEVVRGGFSNAGDLLRHVLNVRRDDLRSEIAARLRDLFHLTKPEHSDRFRGRLSQAFPELTFPTGGMEFQLAETSNERSHLLWEQVDTLACIQRSIKESEEGLSLSFDDAAMCGSATVVRAD